LLENLAVLDFKLGVQQVFDAEFTGDRLGLMHVEGHPEPQSIAQLAIIGGPILAAGVGPLLRLLAIESKCVRAELGAQLHLLGCLLQLLGDVSVEEEWSRGCDGKQLWEVTGRGAAQVQAERRGVFELVADVQGVVFLRDVAVDGLGVRFVLFRRLGRATFLGAIVF